MLCAAEQSLSESGKDMIPITALEETFKKLLKYFTQTHIFFITFQSSAFPETNQKFIQIKCFSSFLQENIKTLGWHSCVQNRPIGPAFGQIWISPILGSFNSEGLAA